jgi:hypothetical protein
MNCVGECEGLELSQTSSVAVVLIPQIAIVDGNLAAVSLNRLWFGHYG